MVDKVFQREESFSTVTVARNRVRGCLFLLSILVRHMQEKILVSLLLNISPR